MSWFGGSKDSSDDSSDYARDMYSSGSDLDGLGASSSIGDLNGGLGGSSSGGGDEAALRLALQQEQQKAVVQAAINKLTELCWDKCVTRPDVKLSSSEQECISNCSERYLDTSMFVMNRMAGQAQSQGR